MRPMKLNPLLALAVILQVTSHVASAELRAGAAIVDVTPVRFPVLVNGGMTSRTAHQVSTRLNARAIVLDDGRERLGIIVVDSCMMPRPLLDEAKQLASQRTKIRPDRMLISATHTHTAPATMGALGTDPDPTYIPFLREKLAEAFATAEANLEPARVGWASANAGEYTALRRWIRRPDRIAEDPFGNPTVRANMHAGRNWEDVVGESGPEDPDLSLIAFQAKDGRPIAVLANFSMHYFSGERQLSADYFGLFCEGLQAAVGKNEKSGRPFVAAMSHGCSGDIWRRDYKQSTAKNWKIDAYSDGLVKTASEAFGKIKYCDDVDLSMAEARMNLKYRVPDQQRLEWARRVVKEMGDRLPKTGQEVYAREQIFLHERQSTEIVVQGLRIGDIGIVTTPNETYALTGLKLKLQSPLKHTMVIELANGGDGYIPPPEQHLLGGYNTWPARSAGLEVQAEPKIVEAGLGLLERVSAKPRRQYKQSIGHGAKAIIDAGPVAYWRLDEMAGPYAHDATGQHHDAMYEPAVAFFLAGPKADLFCKQDGTNRSAHFAGGRLRFRYARLKDQYTISLWCWNGMPADAREVTGWVFSHGHDHSLTGEGEHLGLGGKDNAGRLIFLRGDDKASPLVGKTKLDRWTWNHVVLVRDDQKVFVYLNGNLEIKAGNIADMASTDHFFFGGRCDSKSNWEGRLDEIALFDRPLTKKEIDGLTRNSK